MTEAILTRAGAETLPAVQEDDPESLVRLAVERGVHVDVVERLVALQERMQDRAARAAYFAALAEFQNICPPIKKVKTADIVSKRTGGKFSYSYAPLDEIMRTIRPHLKTCNLSYSFDVEQESKSLLIVICKVRHIDGHMESSRFPVPVETGGTKSDAQENGGALTFGKRQSLASVLGLQIEDDTDATKQPAVAFVTDEQAAAISDLIEESGVKKYKFLEWLGAPTVAEIRAADFEKAVTELQARIKAKRGGDE